MQNIRAARRYARAFFEISLERDRVRDAYRELQTACARIASVPDAVRVLEQPFISNPIKLRACEIVLSEAVSEETIAFVKLLVSRDRGDLLEVIVEEYRRLWHEHEGIKIAHITSAVALTPEEIGALSETFGRITGCRIDPQPEVDPEILGGIVVVIDDRVWDGSVRSALERIRSDLKSSDVVGAVRERLVAQSSA